MRLSKWSLSQTGSFRLLEVPHRGKDGREIYMASVHMLGMSWHDMPYTCITKHIAKCIRLVHHKSPNIDPKHCLQGQRWLVEDAPWSWMPRRYHTTKVVIHSTVYRSICIISAAIKEVCAKLETGYDLPIIIMEIMLSFSQLNILHIIVICRDPSHYD